MIIFDNIKRKMFNSEKHKTILIRILKEIYSDPSLRTALGFKGGTAAYLFYDLPRLSVDLDFDLLAVDKKKEVFENVKKILLQFGSLEEAIEKRNTLFFLLSYDRGERKIKVEISKRLTSSKYEVKNYLGITVLLMKKEDMAANKLAAFLTRSMFASRDLFDLWFFLKSDWSIDEQVVKERLGISLKKALDEAIKKTKTIKPAALLSGLGELVDEKQKMFIKEKLKDELLFNLKLYLQKPE
jgi:hypothetical protein